MFSRDYILRQLQQLVQAISLVLLRKQANQDDLAQGIIHNTMMDVLGVSLDEARGLDREALIALVSPGGELNGDLAVAVADLLSEDQSAEGRLRAAWLYEAALAAAVAVPLDVMDRIENLKQGDPADS